MLFENIKKYICTVLCMMILSVPALAASWPDRPVTIVVPIDAGTLHDASARQLAKYLTVAWKQPVTVVNRSGAAGVVGTQAVATSAPDGYTLGYVSAPFTGVLALRNNVPFKRDDLSGVSMFAKQTFFIFASAAVPYNTVQQMLEYAKANPGKIDYATPGTGSYTHIHMEYMATLRKTTFKHIPYRTMGQAVIDVSEGRVHALTTVISPAIEAQIAKGNIKIIGSLGDSSSYQGQVINSVATVAPEINTQGYYALIAPKGTPRDVIEKIAKDTALAMKDADVMKFFADNAIQTMTPVSGADLDIWFDREIARLRTNIHRANIRVE